MLNIILIELKRYFRKCKDRGVLQNRGVQQGGNHATNAYNTYNDVTAGTTKRREYEESHHNLQMVHHIEEKEIADRSYLIDMRVFKPMSENAMKRLRM